MFSAKDIVFLLFQQAGQSLADNHPLPQPLSRLRERGQGHFDKHHASTPLSPTLSPQAGRGSKSLAANRLIPNPLGLGTLFTQTLPLVRFVFLVVAIEEVPLGIAFGSEDMGGDTVEEPASTVSGFALQYHPE
jgi:hypothetical protein